LLRRLFTTVVAGAVADALIAASGDRSRRGTGLYVLCALVPAVLTAAYLVALAAARGLGWPPNMIAGSPIIAGVAGLFVAFAFDAPLRAAGPSEPPTAV